MRYAIGYRLLTYFDVRLAALMQKNVALDSYATAFACINDQLMNQSIHLEQLPQ